MSRALVVSGGGCKGAYAVGVAKVLMGEKGLTFDVVSGTSTGGLVAPFVAANRIDVAEEFYTSVTTDDILKMRDLSDIVGGPSIATYTPLIGKVREVIGTIGVDSVLGSDTHMFMAGTRLQDRNTVFFHNQDPPDVSDLIFHKLETEDDLVRGMVATASVPAIAPPVDIGPRQTVDGTDIGPYQFVDGGVRENIPVIIPAAMAIEEIYVILLSPQDSPMAAQRYDSLMEIVGRTADALTTDVSGHDLDPINSGKALNTLFTEASASISSQTDMSAEDVRKALTEANPQLGALANAKFTVIGPTTPLTDKVMEFDPVKMKEMLERGEADAKAQAG